MVTLAPEPFLLIARYDASKQRELSERYMVRTFEARCTSGLMEQPRAHKGGSFPKKLGRETV